MRRYSDEFVKKAKALREKERLSIKELSRRIKVPDSTLGNWFAGTVGNSWDCLIISNERKRKRIRNSETCVVKAISTLTRNEAKFLAGLLYGCEGSKYPAHKGMAFANSEPELILTFIKLLRKAFDLNEQKFSVHLQIHTIHNFVELRKYWSQLLGLPERCFTKPTVTAPRGGKHRNVYMGTCTLRYWDYQIQLKLLGIYESFLKSAV